MNLIQNITQEIINEFDNVKTIYDIMEYHNAIPISFINEIHYYLFSVIINNGETLYYRRLFINLNTMENYLVHFDNGTMYGEN